MSRKYHWLLIIVLFLVSAQFIFSHTKLLLQEPAFDFETLYLSGQQALKGENPYLKITNDIVRNPPFAIFIYAIWALFPINLSEILWFAISIVIFFTGSYFLIKALGKNNKRGFNTTNFTLWVIYIILVIRFFPFRWNMGSGQINTFLFTLLCLSFYFMQTGKNYIGTLALAIGISIKITPLFLLFNFLIAKRWKIIFYTFINLLIISSTSIILFYSNGINIIENYLSIPNLYFDFHTTNYHNQSLASFFTRLTSNPKTSQVLTIISLFIGIIIFAATFYLKKSSFKLDILSWNISILYMLIFAPFTWKYHLLIIIFPLLTTAFLLFIQKMSLRLWGILISSYLLLGFHFKSGYLLPNFNPMQAIIFSHVLIGAILLLGLNYYLANKLIK